MIEAAVAVAIVAAVVAFFLTRKRKKKLLKPNFPHYVTIPCNGLPLGGRLRITVDAVGPFPADATLTPFFQREGDDWTARGEMETYRWWASFATTPLVPGRHVLDVPFDANWTAIQSSSRDSNPSAYSQALNNACRVGFTIGDVTGLGHGELAPLTHRIEVTHG